MIEAIKLYELPYLLSLSREELIEIANEMIQAMSNEECCKARSYIREMGYSFD